MESSRVQRISVLVWPKVRGYHWICSVCIIDDVHSFVCCLYSIAGTGSLVKNSVYGLFNTVSKITGSIGKGVSTLSMDEQYMRERQERSVREKPKHVGEGVLLGVRDLGLGIFKGITGIVVCMWGSGWHAACIIYAMAFISFLMICRKSQSKEPLHKASKDFSKESEGVLSGTFIICQNSSSHTDDAYVYLRVAVKPAVGAIDFATQTTRGIRNTATFWDQSKCVRRRPPRHFSADKILEVANHY
jgi:hypothetical protein